MAEPPQAKENEGPASPAPTDQKAPRASVGNDSDPDFDDLDGRRIFCFTFSVVVDSLDVLDQFSAATISQAQIKPQSEPTPSASGPGRPSSSSPSAEPADIPVPHGLVKDDTEDEFMARLTVEMSAVMSQMSKDPAAASGSPEDIARMSKEFEEFTYKMETDGVKPEDLLNAILSEGTGARLDDVTTDEAEHKESETSPSQRQGDGADGDKSKQKSKRKSKSSTNKFEDTIRRTMELMEDSSAKATHATNEATSKSEEDLLAEMLRALESEGGGEGGDSELSKVFLGMMEQLTNKDMLYEPMKELDEKYPSWLVENKSKLKKDEFARFERQRVIVAQIVAKFEEQGYSDDDPKCREFIWEKMQAMQNEGAPPEDLIANPFPGMGLGLGEAETEALGEGCPTQ